jgi:hypothetical protein
VVVDERMVRWVPYKHANGMAVYFRQTPADEGISQVCACPLMDAPAWIELRRLRLECLQAAMVMRRSSRVVVAGTELCVCRSGVLSVGV